MTSLFQSLINLISSTLNALFFIFPNTPFHYLNGQFGEYISQINYFVPVYEFVAVSEAWLVAVGIWYAYSIVARWLKAVE